MQRSAVRRAVAAAAAYSSNSSNNKRRAATAALPPTAVTTLTRGVAGTHTWRLYYQHTSDTAAPLLVSPWHDLARHGRATDDTRDDTRDDGDDAYVFTYVNEIPRATRAKLEMVTAEPHNPIAHDTITSTATTATATAAGGDGASSHTSPQLRYFAYGCCPFDYGFMPQTWESTHACARALGAGCVRGDGDPLDVVLLRPPAAATTAADAAVAVGAVMRVRVLGVLALLDQGELDWKVLAAPLPQHRNDDSGATYTTLSHVPRALCDEVTRWFREYKTAEGKARNEYLFGARILDADAALEVIAQCASEYDALRAGTLTHDGGYWLPQTTAPDARSAQQGDRA